MLTSNPTKYNTPCVVRSPAVVRRHQIPFELPASSKADEQAVAAATKALGQVPTAHTCDNILELPNYWVLLMRAEGRDEKTQACALPAADVRDSSDGRTAL